MSESFSSPSSIVAAFLAQADAHPDAACLAFEPDTPDAETLTYAMLRARAEAWTVAFGAWGLAAGERVALFLGNCPDFLAAYLGAGMAGGVVVPVNTQYRTTELRHIFADAGVRLCLTDVERGRELDRVRHKLPDLAAVVTVGADSDAFLARGGSFMPRPLPHGDEPGVILYTSGTTGRSKGATILHRNMTANIAAVREAWRWTATDHLLLTLPLFHIHGLMVGAHGTLTSGGRMTLRRRFDAAATLDALKTGDATLFFGVPTMYVRLLAEAERAGAPSPPLSPSCAVSPFLRLYVSGSAPLSPDIFLAWRRVFGQAILERYGMTETGMNTTNPHDPADGERRPGTVGRPFPGQEARVVDVRTRAPLPDGDTGEIEVRGPHVFAGYWNRPDATAEAFDPDGWFATGDLGHRDADGYYTISGRAKELIISGGYNIYPREVEELLARCPGVAEVAVIGVLDAEYGESVAAMVVRSDPELSADTLVAFCRDALASYKKPKYVYFVDALPRNAMGKVQKHLLRERM